MADTGLAKKLLIKSGMTVLLHNEPVEYRTTLGDLPAGVLVATNTERPADIVHLFVRNRGDLERDVAAAIAAVKPGGIFWISYLKGGAKAGTDLNRDSLWAAMQPYGWRPVTAVAIDDRWSALRFRPNEDVGT